MGVTEAGREGVARTVMVVSGSSYSRRSYYLFDVTRETAKMVFGNSRRWGSRTREERESKAAIVKDPATLLDVERIESAQAECDRRTKAAREWEKMRIAEIIADQPATPTPSERTKTRGAT